MELIAECASRFRCITASGIATAEVKNLKSRGK
jgi:hypothetical protein